jgi:glycosyltransferase involved in cell wall biosynthesis
MAKVTIITPCYNAEAFIAKTIESIRNQTFTDWEHLIVDDGSTDKSAEIVSSYMLDEPRLRLLRQGNSGACNARNHGFKACSPASEYLLFFDADDVLEPNMLKVMVEYLDHHPQVGLAYCDVWYIDTEDQVLETPPYRRFVPSGLGIQEIPYETPQTPLVCVACGGGLYESCCVLRRSIYELTNGWDEWIDQGTEGVDLFTQFALHSEVHFIPEKLYKYRQSPHQATRTTIDFKKQRQKLIAKWKEGKWLNPEQKARINEIIWLYEKRLEPLFNINHGTNLLFQGQFSPGVELCWEGIRTYCMSFIN